MQDRAAEQSATHSVPPTNGSHHHQGRTAKSENQASRWFCLQHVHLLPWEHQGVHCTHCHCCSPPHHQAEGAGRTVQEAWEGCCEADRDVQVSSEGCWVQGPVLSDDDVEVRKLEIKEIQMMLQEAQKQHNKAITKTYKLLRNLLSCDPQSQRDFISRKMHGRDLWAGENSQVTVWRHPCTWAAFRDCLELHKLTVFTADAAERQQFYIQRCPSPRGPLCNSISCKWEC
jgi:hypothetical protein